MKVSPAPTVSTTVVGKPGIRVMSASILRDSRDGRYPSDHYPVVARVQLPTSR